MYDHLTKLPQEQYLKNKYNDYIENKCAYMVAIDFAKLKYINDNFGHEEGDNCLLCFSNLTNQYFSDSIVCRFHGDEFCILTCADSEEIKKRLEMVKNDINKIHESAKIKFPFSFNCGIKRCENDYLETKEKSDYAMYCAKKSSKLYKDFSNEDFCTKLEEEEFIAKIDEMVKDEQYEFKFHYQLIKDYQSGKNLMMELYARDSKGNKLFDYDSYRLLRKNYRMKQIDLKIFSKLFKNYNKKSFNGFPILLNISHQTVMASEIELEEMLLELLKDKAIDLSNIILTINILEFDGSIDLLIQKINGLKDLGFKIGLDDLNVDTSQLFLKIIHSCDLDFVKIRNITLFRAMNDKKSGIIFQSFITIIKSFNIIPIFTKIEVPELLDYISNMCPESLIKGNYISEEIQLEETLD